MSIKFGKYDVNGIENYMSYFIKIDWIKMFLFFLNFRKYFVVFCLWFFIVLLILVVLGSIFVYKSIGDFSISVFLVICLLVLLVYVVGNLVNIYFDYLKGIDSKKISDDRILVDNVLFLVVVLNLGVLFYIVGCFGCFILIIIFLVKMEYFVFMYFGGLFSSFLYIGGFGLKYIVLGDLLIFFTFGLLIVMFLYFS